MSAPTSLAGPYELFFDRLANVVPERTCGVFALGHVDRAGIFRVQCVGRDDVDLRDRLRELIGSSTSFKFATTETAHEAFLRECELFHTFQPPRNFNHPIRPAGSGWTCRLCRSTHP